MNSSLKQKKDHVRLLYLLSEHWEFLICIQMGWVKIWTPTNIKRFSEDYFISIKNYYIYREQHMLKMIYVKNHQIIKILKIKVNK